MEFQPTIIDFSTSHFREFNPRQPFISTFPSLSEVESTSDKGKFDLSSVEEVREIFEKSLNDIIQLPTPIQVKSYISSFSLPKPNFTLATITKWEPTSRALSEAERELFEDENAPRNALSFKCHAPFLCFTLGNSSEFNLPIFNVTSAEGERGLAVNLPIIRVYTPVPQNLPGGEGSSLKGKEEDMESCD